MEGYWELACDSDNAFEVIDLENLPALLSFDALNDDIDVYDMTSLSTLLLLSQASYSDHNRSAEKFRLSLAYERLQTIPKLLLQELAPVIKILDISNNNFENLNFLGEFKQLTSLVCDHNKITSHTEIPYMPNLELLWMNHCQVKDLYPWAKFVQRSCPNLRHLSLMGNPAAPSYLNGGTFYEYLHYRYFVISLFPNLVHLDDRAVTEDQRDEALRLYKRPLLERVASKTSNNLPTYLRQVSDKVSDIFAPTPPFTTSQRNIII